MKYNRLCSAIAAVCAMLLPLQASADEQQTVERPVLSAYTIDAGSSHVAETYLSPLKYSGWSTALNYERTQAMRFSPRRWTMRLHGRLALERTQNPARNANMWGLDLNIGWAITRRFRLDSRWNILAGGNIAVNGGALYNTRNGNNPVAAKASWTVGASTGAIFNTRIGSIPISARYIAEMPLTGIFFSPEYGELYYEIYLGNHKGLVRGAWPGNFFRLDNLATVDIRLGRTIIRAGYRCGIFSSKASHIVTRRISHSFVLGLASEWVSLSPKGAGKLAEAEIISSQY